MLFIEKKKIAVAILGYGLLFGCNTAKQTWGVRDSDLHTPQATELITHDPDTGEAVDPFTVITKEGHRVYFAHTNGEWMAQVTENLPAGFSNVVTLPINCVEGFSVEDLAKITPALQKQYLYVNLRSSSSDTTRHVYKGGYFIPIRGSVTLGKVGLQGGGGNVSTCSSNDLWDIPEAIALTAENQIGSDNWSYEGSRWHFGPKTNKCNLFVFEIIAAVGAKASERSRSEDWYKRLFRRPLTAEEWADNNKYIPNWNVVHTPKRGDIVAEKRTYYSDATGHVGIVVQEPPCGESVSVDDYVVKSPFGFRSSENPVFRRFTGSSWALIDSLTGGNVNL